MRSFAVRRWASSPAAVMVLKHLSIVVAVLVGLAVFGLLTTRQLTSRNGLVSWNFAAGVYIVMTWWRMLRASVARIRQRAAADDFSDVVLLFLSIAAALASVAGIAVGLLGVKDVAPDIALVHAGEAFLTILVSWAFLHTLFTTHYAHRYYSEREEGTRLPLRFPDGVEEPDYWDFLYFSFTIGVASQTADVEVGSTTMRRLALLHSVLSFLFNTTILALAINVGASLL
jgi:uncharacterized membrane protein